MDFSVFNPFENEFEVRTTFYSPAKNAADEDFLLIPGCYRFLQVVGLSNLWVHGSVQVQSLLCNVSKSPLQSYIWGWKEMAGHFEQRLASKVWIGFHFIFEHCSINKLSRRKRGDSVEKLTTKSERCPIIFGLTQNLRFSQIEKLSKGSSGIDSELWNRNVRVETLESKVEKSQPSQLEWSNRQPVL